MARTLSSRTAEGAFSSFDSGGGREDQPVVGGTTAVAPRATYTITSAAERAITTAAAR
ncbi:hypothetical protein JL720_7190 [Aureococcus anophagefferens]|nr:hypothetical protein JL720_7190 [Aureococcus anophagefferens]